MAQRGAGDRQTVFASPDDADVERVRLAASSPEELLDAVIESGEPGGLLVELDPAIDSIDNFADDADRTDQLVALTAVLVQRGVTAIETTHVRSVRRIFDTHAAIASGSVEAIS